MGKRKALTSAFLGGRRDCDRAILGIMLTLILMTAFMWVKIEFVSAEPKTWIVDDDGPADFSSIQAAINASNQGDTIHVRMGTYYERISITKSLTLEGEDKNTTIIDGQRLGTVVQVSANNVVVKGFTVQNSSTWFTAGISIYMSDGCEISDNLVQKNDFGIALGYSYFCNVSNNIVTNNYEGVYLNNAGNNLVSYNNISECGQGITISNCLNPNTLRHNNVVNNSNNFYVSGSILEHFVQDVDSTNMINGKPIYYLVNEHGKQIPSDAGFIAAVNSTNISIANVSIANNQPGILLAYTNMSTINNVTLLPNSGVGVRFFASHFNTMKNSIINSDLRNAGIKLDYSSGNRIFHNNFAKCIMSTMESYPNYWDDGYPSGGNYWSDYNGTDANGDGIGDTPYVIGSDNQDQYPLMAPFNVFDAGTWNGLPYNVNVVSNSTVSDFYFNPDEGAFFMFNVTGEGGTVGFCRVAIPKDLLWSEDGWTVLVGGEQVDYTMTSDENYIYLYFTYQHSIKTVTIQGTHVIPEFSFFAILPLFMITTLLAAIIRRRKQ